MAINIAIFASGTGSNAEKIIQHFANIKAINVALIAANKENAGVLNFSEKYKIPSLVFNKAQFVDVNFLVNKLKNFSINYVILAGFLWKIPSHLIDAFPNKIINIHPALLPNYGGKGMYGMHVHLAVFEAKEKYSGITIHLVDQHYDHGNHLFQAKVDVANAGSAKEIQERVLALEHKYFATTIENYIKENEF